jgi:hypothetical protein
MQATKDTKATKDSGAAFGGPGPAEAGPHN